jgi:hypothetical protein
VLSFAGHAGSTQAPLPETESRPSSSREGGDCLEQYARSTGADNAAPLGALTAEGGHPSPSPAVKRVTCGSRGNHTSKKTN